MTKKLRWGIIGAASIAEDMAQSISLSSNGMVNAIASRTLARADEWARAHNVQHAFGSYDDMLESGLVDIVYNPLPNSLHAEWTVRAIEAGLPVLCEKPFGRNAAEARAVALVAAHARAFAGSRPATASTRQPGTARMPGITLSAMDAQPRMPQRNGAVGSGLGGMVVTP